MFGNYFFESTSQTLGADGDIEIRGETGRIEFGMGSRLLVDSAFSFESSSQPDLALETTSTSQEMMIGESQFSTSSEIVNISQAGIQVAAEANQMQWNAGSFGIEMTSHDYSVTPILDESLSSPELEPADLPADLPPAGIRSQLSSLELSGPLGVISVISESIETGGGPTLASEASIQNTTVIWSLGSGALQLNGLVNESTTAEAPAAMNEFCPQNNWMEQTISNSFSLEFASELGGISNPTGSPQSGMSLSQTTSTFNMGPGQLQLQTQRLDTFAGFAGVGVSGTWMSQSQSVADLSLAIA